MYNVEKIEMRCSVSEEVHRRMKLTFFIYIIFIVIAAIPFNTNYGTTSFAYRRTATRHQTYRVPVSLTLPVYTGTFPISDGHFVTINLQIRQKLKNVVLHHTWM